MIDSTSQDKVHLDIFMLTTEQSIKYLVDEVFGIMYETVSKELNFEYSIKVDSEDRLKTQEYFPNGALVCTHGGRLSAYDNLKAIMHLTSQRPDMRFIVRLESDLEQYTFPDEESFKHYHSLAGLDMDPSNPVSPLFGPLGYLITPGCSENKLFNVYLTKLVQMRREAQRGVQNG